MRYENFEYEIKFGLAKILSYNGKDKDVVIPEQINGKNVYTICSNAFLSLDNIESIVIPKTVGCIQDSAICDCENLKRIYLPIVEELGDFIEDCYQKILIETPSPRMACKVERMNKDFDIFCEKDFKYTVLNENKKECRIDSIRFRSSNAFMPDIIDGYKVVELGFTFDNNKKVFERVKLPKFLKAIPAHFFKSRNFKEVEIGNDIERIGDYAFYSTYIENFNDNEFVITNKLKKVGKYAFGNSNFNICFEKNTSLEVNEGSFMGTNLDARNLVKTNLAPRLFYKTQLSNFSVNEDNIRVPFECFRESILSNFKGFEVFENIELYAFSGCKFEENFELDLSNIKSLEDFGFNNISVKSIFIPKELKLTRSLFCNTICEKVEFAEDYVFDTVPESCFRNMKKLEECILPKAIKNLGRYAFSYICDLRKINLENIERIEECCFSYSGLNSKVILGKNLSYLGNGAFNYAEISEVVFEDSPLEEIPAYAFNYCKNLKEVQLSNNIKKIKREAFKSTSIIDIDLKNVETIEASVFDRCHYLIEVKGLNVKEIYHGAFRYCKNLVKVVFGNSLKILDTYVFSYCSKLETLKLPDSVEGIGGYCFEESNISELRIPKKLIELKYSIFASMRNLKKVVINDNVKRIPVGCFNSLFNLEELILGKNVEHLDTNSIYMCPNLKKLVLPEGVKRLKHDCISNCASLEEVHILGTIDCLNTGVFAYCPSLTKIHTDDFETGKKLVKRVSTSIEEIVPINKTLPKKRTKKSSVEVVKEISIDLV